ERAQMIEAAREIMALYEQGADWSDPALWPGIKGRAAARARAGRERPHRGLPGARFDRAQVRTSRVALPYASFFAVEEHHLRFPLSDGGLSEEVRRAVWATGDAVTVLPYDARRDAVLLVAQWRAGPHARGDRMPWPVEVIAGRMDGMEPHETAARREAREEAGLRLGRMERIAGYYPSPGTFAEHVTSFVGEADLSEAGGAGGLAEEHEDIVSAVLDFEAAMELVARDEANTSPALISLLWLAGARARLRREWGA
ncbi:MAG: NUDIX domain-containing protein, partial [Pseudomonadota bacterium]